MIKNRSGTFQNVIPAPLTLEADGGCEFIFRSDLVVAYTDACVASMAQRFCADVARRTGMRFMPMAGHPGPGEPSIVIHVASDDDIEALPGPTGIVPVGDGPVDERHSITIAGTRVVVRAVGPVGVARGLTTLIQVLATVPGSDTREISVHCGRILDAPRYAWRGLSLDLSRCFFTVAEIKRVIDLVALYKLNVLHLHLTDDQSWRLPMGRPCAEAGSNDRDFYSNEELGALVRYASDRYVTIVPEVDTPGHAAALMRLNPLLDTGRNNTEVRHNVGHGSRNAWLDPALPATFTLIEEILVGVAGIFPGSYIHIGGDEPYGMPRDLYQAYIERVRRFVRSIGKQPIGWQESARAGLGPGDVIQYWLPGSAPAQSLPAEPSGGVPEQEASGVAARDDIETAVAASAPIIVSPLSHCYLDVPYAEPGADGTQAARQRRVGLRCYAPKTVAASFQWEPGQAVGPRNTARVAGVEAAIWAETISSFDDLSFLLLPRLPGIAEKAWSAPGAADWSRHRDRLAHHGRVWRQDDLMYFLTSSVAWL
jgi:hexosaminidase